MNAVFGVRWNDNVKRVPLALMAIALLASSFVSQPGAAQALSAEAGELISVIVRELPGTGDAPERFIESAGGTVEEELRIINGYVAKVPAAAATQLEKVPGVHSVTSNGRVKLLGGPNGKGHGNKRGHETGSLDYIANGATGAMSYYGAGYYGQGVDVAMIDSGVVPVEGLADDKVVHGPDLSFESQADDLRHLDTFGHGTHMAGIIAGLDPTRRGNQDYFAGVAPKARIVSLKVADAEGATDVSQVIAAIDWVVQHRRDNGMNIRVLNLSFGTDGTQNYRLDPLTYAAEVAWRKGIVVVVAAGNEGYGSKQLNNPAYDPFVIAVGASDPEQTWGVADDRLADFSSRGDGRRNPDLVAPGKSIISLRATGSAIDLAYPEGRLGERFFRGSGTSQAAAVVSGAAALVISQRPGVTPDEVKGLLTRTARPLPEADRRGQGAGLLNLAAALKAPSLGEVQLYTPATGTGSLEEARGSSQLVDGSIELSGEQDIFGTPWDANRWSIESLAETSWNGGTWNGIRWTGDTWLANRWSSALWEANRWSGASWSELTLSSNRWSSNRWSGDGWTSNRWSGDTWSSNRWSSNRWSSSMWGS